MDGNKLIELIETEFKSSIHKEMFNSSILDYNSFINQTIFEIYYLTYKKNCETVSILSLAESLADKDDKYFESQYKKLLRTYKNFRKYQDKLSLKYNNGKDVKFEHLSNMKECLEGHKIYKYQVNQLLNLANGKYKIFDIIRKENIGNIKNLTDSQFTEYLKVYDNISDDIDCQEKTYFERSFQYYQLEIGNRIGTWYKIINKLNTYSLIKKCKEKILDDFNNCFFPTNFIIGIDCYIDYYIDNNLKMHDISKVQKIIRLELYILNYKKYNIVVKILDYIEKENLKLDFSDKNLFFNKFIDSIEYIYIDKDWTKQKVNLYRSLFK